MKRLFLLFLLLALTSVLCASLAAAGEEDTTPAVSGLITVSGARLREQPTRLNPGFFVPEFETVVEILEETENSEGLWYRIRFPAGEEAAEGYILSDYCSRMTPEELRAYLSKPEKMYVSVKATCLYYDHVGSNWSSSFRVNGRELPGGVGTALLHPGDIVTAAVTMTEIDTDPDVGYSECSYSVTQYDLKTAFRMETDVYVTENRGRYSGHTACWHIVFTFTK